MHSDLTTGIMLADLVAYIVSFNIRFGRMIVARRDDLNDAGGKVLQQRPRPVDRADVLDSFAGWSPLKAAI